ncbi:MAG TPA: UbiA family prenyltransferase, partial [Alphaproteobacteria bacterium]|nr:UbiA family prenyltransferase [Alphaproteobacteria bacterium]
MAQVTGTSASDIPKGGWVDRLAPPALRPYARLARLDRPIGTWLLLFPCWWGIALATPDWPSLMLMAIFALGAIVMRGAGCTYNDIVDRDFDARVARTADRPIPSGAVSVRQAVAFLLAQLLVGLLILLSLSATAIWLGVLSLALVFTYPL